MEDAPIMTELQEKNKAKLELTADIVSAYVANNPVPANELQSLIDSTHRTLASLTSDASEQSAEPQRPAVSVKKSVTHDHLVCLEDGMKFRSLKRHLATQHDMTPEEYRVKWRLAADYPMTAPAYSIARSSLAKAVGLGRKRHVEPEPAPVSAKRGRKPKAT